MMKRWGIKSGIVLILLGTLFYMGMLHSKQIPATALDGLKAIKAIVLELLATSEYSDSEELKKRLVATSEAFKKYAHEYGTMLGLGDDASSSTASNSGISLLTVTPMLAPAATSTATPTTPAIVVATPSAGVSSISGESAVPAPDATDATVQEITPEPPAAALGASVAPGGEPVQPPAVLAASAPVAPAPVAPAPGGVLIQPSVAQGAPDVQPLVDLSTPIGQVASVPAPVLGIPVIPDVTGTMSVGDLNTLPSLGEITPVVPAAPVVPAPGTITPIAPLSPTLGAVPAPMPPAPGAMPPAMTMPGLPGLQALPPLAYHELESLDGEMDQLMAMSLPEAPVFFNIQPFETVSAFEQENQEMELMSVVMQDSPAIVMDQTLDDLNLNDLTLAGLE